MDLINLRMLSHPMNYAIVTLMLIIALFAFDAVMRWHSSGDPVTA